MGNITIQSRSILAVEGMDEYHLFSALFKYLSIESIQILVVDGKNKFKAEFLAFSNAEGFDKVENVGFVLDADDNHPQSAFNSICDILQLRRLPQPVWPNRITSNTVPQTGIFIMPNNNGSGMLEDLCLETIALHPINNCIDNFITCCLQYQDEHEALLFKHQKARVQAYLATRAPIVHSLGLGAQKGYWDFDNPCFDSIKSFLTTLFL